MSSRLNLHRNSDVKHVIYILEDQCQFVKNFGTFDKMCKVERISSHCLLIFGKLCAIILDFFLSSRSPKISCNVNAMHRVAPQLEYNKISYSINFHLHFRRITFPGIFKKLERKKKINIILLKTK